MVDTFVFASEELIAPINRAITREGKKYKRQITDEPEF